MFLLSGLAALTVYTVVRFYIFKPTRLPQPEKESIRLSPVHKVVAVNGSSHGPQGSLGSKKQL